MAGRLSELARVRDEAKSQEAQKVAHGKADSIIAANAIAEECREYFVREKGLQAQIIQRDELIEMTLNRRFARIRFLNPNFILLTTQSEKPEQNQVDIPIGPELVLQQILDHFDV